MNEATIFPALNQEFTRYFHYFSPFRPENQPIRFLSKFNRIPGLDDRHTRQWRLVAMGSGPAWRLL